MNDDKTGLSLSKATTLLKAPRTWSLELQVWMENWSEYRPADGHHPD